MRFDDIGLFWQDYPTAKKTNKNRIRSMPPLPATGWKPVRDFPNLKLAKSIGFDTETFDPDLTNDHGPGWARGNGNIIGFSVSVSNKDSWYFPIRHQIFPDQNINPEHALKWLGDTLSIERPKIGANLLYDFGWLTEEKIPYKGPFFDIQFAEALLSEDTETNLDFLANKYLGLSKEASLLYQWSYDFYGGSKKDQRENIYRCPQSLVGPYAEADAALPKQIFKIQKERLKEQNLWNLFLRECRLIPILIEMRFAGMSVDVERAEDILKQLSLDADQKTKELENEIGFPVNVYQATSLQRVFEKYSLKYSLTKKSKKPSFTTNSLETVNHPVAKKIIDIKKVDRMKTTFVDNFIIKGHVNGKIHCSFHPLRSDEDGTRSGRFSATHPNLQQIPKRNKIYGPMLRSLFIPDFGHKNLIRYDYSQIEYRFLVHFAVGIGALEAQEAYRLNPKTDFHRFAQELVQRIAKIFIERDSIKNVNFGIIYGVGPKKLANDLHLTLQKTKNILRQYDTALPFARETMRSCIEEAESLGYITTILNRKSRFNLWLPDGIYGKDNPVKALPYDEAIDNYGTNIKRAGTYKALNRRLQGSAADLAKEALLQGYEEGAFKNTGVPRLTVHDEFVFSNPGGFGNDFLRIREIMETALTLKIPLIANMEYGPNWGNLQEVV